MVWDLGVIYFSLSKFLGGAVEMLNQCLTAAVKGLRTKNLKLNLGKTEVMLAGKAEVFKNNEFPIFDGVQLPLADSVKSLEVALDPGEANKCSSSKIRKQFCHLCLAQKMTAYLASTDQATWMLQLLQG